jgi:hypothetical protein
MSGLLDFGSGSMQGAGTGLATFGALKAGGALSAGVTLANPWALGAMGAATLASGALNYFAGRDEDRLARKANKQNFKLNQLQIDQLEGQNRDDRDTRRRKNAFRNAFTQSMGAR